MSFYSEPLENLIAPHPNASFLGFTSTPIEKANANTRADFGGNISIHDIQRAVANQATATIHFERPISTLNLNAD